MEREGIYKEPEYGFDDKILDDLFSEQVPLKVASKEQRFVNFMFDQFIMFIIFFFLFALMGGLISFFEGINGSSSLSSGQDLIVFFFFLFCLSTYVNYYIFFEYFADGKTLGKRITGTKVVKKDGSDPSFKDILVRTLCRYLPFEVLSFLGASPDGWHDRISETIVVIDTPKQTSEFV